MLSRFSNAPSITGITVEGFKSIGERRHIRIAPLTVLAGANSSGKSSIMQPLLLLKQTIEASYDPGALLLTGTNIKFSDSTQILTHKKGVNNPGQFSLTLAFDNSDLIQQSFTFSSNEHRGIETSAVMIEFNDSVSIKFTRIMTSKAIQSQLLKLSGSKEEKTSIENLRFEIASQRCFLTPQTDEGRLVTSLFPIYQANATCSQFITSLIHLPGLRGNPERAYPVTAIGQKYQGRFEDYAASLLVDWESSHSTDSSKLKTLSNELKRLGLTWKVQAKRVNATQVELRVGRTRIASQGGAKDLVNIADVGFGLSQSLPVLVALVAASPGDTVYIEQPEIHLHPKAQIALASTLVAAANRGVRLIIETHSSLLILGIQTEIAQQTITSENVALHWFSRSTDGTTTVSTANLEQDGSFGDWPSDFDEVTLDSQQTYLEVASRL